MIRYSIIFISTCLNAAQYYNDYKEGPLNWQPFITKLNITTGIMLILTYFITKLITMQFDMKNLQGKKYDEGKPIFGASIIADLLSFAIASFLVMLLP